MELDWLFYYDPSTLDLPELPDIEPVIQEYLRSGSVNPDKDRLIHGTSVQFVKGVISSEYLIVGIQCPTCERKSYHPGDAINRYCQKCGYHTAPTSQFICQRLPQLR